MYAEADGLHEDRKCPDVFDLPFTIKEKNKN